MIHDWGTDMAAFLAWRAEHPLSDEQKALGKDYRGNPANMHTGHEVLLRKGEWGTGTMVPLDVERGMDGGLFWNGSDW